MEKGQGGIKITLEEASWIGRTIQIKNQVGEEALHCYSNLLGTLYSQGALLIESHRFFSNPGMYGLQHGTRCSGLRQFAPGKETGHVLVRNPRGPVLRCHRIVPRQSPDLPWQLYGRVSAVHALRNCRWVNPVVFNRWYTQFN